MIDENKIIGIFVDMFTVPMSALNAARRHKRKTPLLIHTDAEKKANGIAKAKFNRASRRAALSPTELKAVLAKEAAYARHHKRLKRLREKENG